MLGLHTYRALPITATPVTHVTVPPASDLVVTLGEVKEHLAYGSEADVARDAELVAFIRAAQRQVEYLCDITLLQTTFRADFVEFASIMPLEKRPYASLTSIEYVAPTTGTITTVDAATYHVVADHKQTAKVYLGKGLEWPEIAERVDAVRITYAAGWTFESVPDDIRLAIKMLVAKYDANRGDCDDSGGGGQTVYAMKNSRDPIAAILAPYTTRRVYIA